jgi:excisionase family DNA binding protein
MIVSMTTVNDFLTVQEAAAEYRVSTQTVYRFIADGRLPTAQWGRQYRINRRSLEALVAMAAQKP